MGKRNKVTTRDIAEYTGLSQSTVSMVLSNKSGVSFMPETVELVQSAAKKLGYKKPQKADRQKSLALAKSIIIICPILSNAYYTTMIHAITERAKDYDYTVFTVTTLRDVSKEELYLNLLSGFELAGVISLYPPRKIAEANALSKQVPVVSIGDKPEGCRFDSVELDSKKPGYLLAEHLISLGHTHITYISSPIRAKEIGRLHRLQGVEQCFIDHGISTDLLEVKTPTIATYASYPSNNMEYLNGYDCAKSVIKQGTDSTAFIANSDTTAFGVLAAISDCGYKVPSDFSVCGFDNISMSAMPQISLTTIDHAATLKGQEAVDMIYKKNVQKERPSSKNYIIHMEYEPELIVRSSTGRAPK